MNTAEVLERNYMRRYSLTHPVVVFFCTMPCVWYLDSLNRNLLWVYVIAAGGLFATFVSRPEGAMMVELKNNYFLITSGGPKGSPSALALEQGAFSLVSENKKWLRLRHPRLKKSFFFFRSWRKANVNYQINFDSGSLSFAPFIEH